MAGTGVYGYRLAPGQVVGVERIDGLLEVQRDLNRLGDDTKNEMQQTHLQAAEIVVLGAKRLVPYRTGRLAASIRAHATKASGRVRAGSASVPYAGPIHFGWPARRIAPQPFIYDALDPRRDDIKRLYEDRINELVEKYDLTAGTGLKRLRATRAAAGRDTGRMPDAFLRDTSGSIIGGVYGLDVVYF